MTRLVHPPPGLLDAVRTYPDPEDWESWLVFADWLMERDDPRAEVIVRAHQGLPPDPPDVPTWAPTAPLPRGAALGWRHGFVVEVRWSSLAPVDEHLRALRALDADPAMVLWTALEWWVARDDRSVELDDDGAVALAAEPALARLRSLTLGLHYKVGDLGVAAVARSPRLQKLRRLCLYCAGYGAPGVEAVASSPALAGLRALDLSGGHEAGDDGLRALARSTTLRALESLDVGHFRAGSDAVLELLRSPVLTTVEALVLRGNEASEDVLRALATEGVVPRLERLELDVLDEAALRGVLALIEGHPALRALVLHIAPQPGWREEVRAAAARRGIVVHEWP